MGSHERTIAGPRAFRPRLRVLLVVMIAAALAVLTSWNMPVVGASPDLASPTAASPAPAPEGRRVVAYFPLWVRDMGYTEDQIDFSLVTHVVHFSVIPQADGSIKVPTEWGTFPDPALVSTTHAAGARVVLAVGGDYPGAAEGFATMAAGAATRQTFVRNLTTLVTSYGYDGVDLDWEFPENAADRDHLTELVTELRAALGPASTLSIAAPAGDWSARWLDLAALLPHLDWIGAMTYDFHGVGWSSYAGHNAALYTPERQEVARSGGGSSYGGGFSVDASRRYYLGRGVPAAKLLLGLPFYGQRFDGATRINQPLTNTSGGAVNYRDVVELIGNGWTAHYDDEALVPYLLRAAGGVISYDDPMSIRTKCTYTTSQGLGGVIIWHLGKDYVGGDQPLLRAAAGCR